MDHCSSDLWGHPGIFVLFRYFPEAPIVRRPPPVPRAWGPPKPAAGTKALGKQIWTESQRLDSSFPSFWQQHPNCIARRLIFFLALVMYVYISSEFRVWSSRSFVCVINITHTEHVTTHIISPSCGELYLSWIAQWLWWTILAYGLCRPLPHLNFPVYGAAYHGRGTWHDGIGLQGSLYLPMGLHQFSNSLAFRVRQGFYHPGTVVG